jgi:ferrous iron transport protein A
VSDHPALVVLAALPTGGRGTIAALSGGAAFVRRLAGMGLTVGADVQILQNKGRGPLLIHVRETRLAIGRGEALRVLVRGPGEAGLGADR